MTEQQLITEIESLLQSIPQLTDNLALEWQEQLHKLDIQQLTELHQILIKADQDAQNLVAEIGSQDSSIFTKLNQILHQSEKSFTQTQEKVSREEDQEKLSDLDNILKQM